MTTELRFRIYDLLRRAIEDALVRTDYALDPLLIDAIMEELGQVIDLTGDDDGTIESRGE